jgi:leucyl-tRNA synthetase
VEVPVQIMGKVRHRIIVPATADAAQLEALALGDAKVQELISGKTVRKVVAVPGKLINIVAN